MRSYLIDELSFLERDNLDSYLKRNLKAGALEGVFFLAIPPELHGSSQQEHHECAPFYCAFVLGKDSLRCELLIRSSHNLHCSCIAPATPEQRLFIFDFVDQMLREELIGA
ncbi:MAG: hypothetical protein GX087_07485 [Desulfobulbaceae bacterium]|nr:hypothetical protein [Desulfobulbaceae bacterium]